MDNGVSERTTLNGISERRQVLARTVAGGVVRHDDLNIGRPLIKYRFQGILQIVKPVAGRDNDRNQGRGFFFDDKRFKIVIAYFGLYTGGARLILPQSGTEISGCLRGGGGRLRPFVNEDEVHALIVLRPRPMKGCARPAAHSLI